MIFVTGIAGFIGRHVADRLIREGKSFSCLVRNADSSFLQYLSSNGVKVVKGSVEDLPILLEATKDVSTIIHLAASLDGDFSMNVKGTENIIECCRRNKVKRLVYMSSFLAQERFLRNGYAKSKLEAEQLVVKSGLHSIIIKPTWVYGKGDRRSFSRLVSLIRISPVVPIIGDGEYKVQPVFVEDLVDIILKDRKEGVVYVAGKEIVTFRQLMGIMAEEMGKRRVFIRVPYVIAKVLGSRMRDEISTLRFDKVIAEGMPKELGATPLRQGIREAV